MRHHLPELAWYRVVWFADQFGISVSYAPLLLVIAQAVSALDGLSPQQTSFSAPPSARTQSHSDRFGGTSDRPLALART